ncbi:hypothetical protein BDV09DRAFT_201866 [Aspergillus tetrazonus]
MAQSFHGPDDVYTSAVDEEVVREFPAHPYACEYEYENGPASARARTWENTATSTARHSWRQQETTRSTHIKRNWNHDRRRDHNNNSDSVMMEKTMTGIRTTSNASPIRTINHTPATRNVAFIRDLGSADAGPESQAMQTYSSRQVSTTMNGAGEIKSHQEVSTQQFGQDHLHENNSGLKLKLDLNLDVEVELKAKIHGNLTLALLYTLNKMHDRSGSIPERQEGDPWILEIVEVCFCGSGRIWPALDAVPYTPAACPPYRSPHAVSLDDERHLSQPSASPDPSASEAWARGRRPPKLRRRQPQDSGEPSLPPDNAMPLAQPARNNLSKQSPEGGDSHAHVNGAGLDDERDGHRHEHGRGSNSHSTAPSSELAPSSEAEETSSLGVESTPAHPRARNMQQRIILDRSQDGEGRESQRLMQINNLENPAGEMVRDTQTKTVKRVNGVKDGVIGSITRHGHERGLQERSGKTNDNEQWRLRLDLNLDLEVQLKAKIRGDLTLQLM